MTMETIYIKPLFVWFVLLTTVGLASVKLVSNLNIPLSSNQLIF